MLLVAAFCSCCLKAAWLPRATAEVFSYVISDVSRGEGQGQEEGGIFTACRVEPMKSDVAALGSEKNSLSGQR